MVAPKHIKELQHKSRDLVAKRVDKHTYRVESASDPHTKHQVTIHFDDDGRTIHADCTCAWASFNGVACSHVLAALEYMALMKDRTLSFWTDEESARRQKHRLFYLIGKRQPQNGVWITSRSA